MKNSYRILSLYCFIVCNVLWASAQRVVDFSADKTSGCSPLIVSFSNSSTFPASATYLWDFGNGNTSTAKNPMVTYSSVGNYTVELTVTDGAEIKSLKKTDYIVVNGKPAVDFSVSNNGEGCVPLTIDYTYLPQANSVPVASYNWGFGDGNVSSIENPQNIYNIKGQFDVTLVVIDVNGCSNSITKNKLISAYRPEAKFGPDKTYDCDGELAVKFNNSSVSDLNFQSTWTFGDGQQSSEKSPTYTYKSKGVYSVSLRVVDTYGCSSTITATDLIKLDKVDAAFTSSKDLVCANQVFTLANQSKDADSFLWTLGDGTTSDEKELNKSYSTSGNYTIKLKAVKKGCFSEVTKPIVVEHLNLTFLPVDTFLCNTDKPMTYSSSKDNIIAWDWRFGNGATSTSRTPTNHFLSDQELETTFKKVYSDTLIVTSSNGCKFKKVNKNNITIQIPSVKINSNAPLQACLPHTIGFSSTIVYNTTRDAIVSSSWLVNNSVSFAQPAFSYEFKEAGKIPVQLTVATKNGCVHRSAVNVGAGERLNLDFTMTPSGSVCASEMINFINKTPGLDKINSVSWDFGDGSDLFPFDNPPHQYEKTGSMDVTLTAFSNGCKSVLKKPNALFIKGPIAKASNVMDCNKPLTYVFNSKLIDTDSYQWRFGDGSAAVDNLSSVAHDYTSTGNYNAELVAYNAQTGCSFVSLNKLLVRDLKSQFTISDGIKCPNTPFTFDPSNSQDVVPFQFNNGFRKYLWLLDGKTIFNDTPLTYQFNSRGVYPVQLVVKDVNNCVDTLTQDVQIYQPLVDFKSNYKLGCMPVVFDFNDLTTSNANLVKWEWNFGDGVLSNLQNDEHEYTAYGKYTVSLKVEDDQGCVATKTNKEVVSAIFPDASFVVSDPTACVNQEVVFSDTSESDIVDYTWEFDGSTTSKLATPKLMLTKEGYTTVKLTIVDKHGCTSSSEKVNYIHTQEPPVVDFSTSDTYSNCYPFLVQFKDLSVSPYLGSWEWVFDQGSNRSVLQDPSFIYSKPGDYDVKLISKSTYGCATELVKPKLIHVGGPYAKIQVNDTICMKSEITFSAIDQSNIFELLWDFGDGYFKEGDEVVHTYFSEGDKYPALVLKSDDNGTCNKVLPDTINVLNLKSQFSHLPLVTQGCVPFKLDFTNQSVNASSVYWSFANGDVSVDNKPTVVYELPNDYRMKLIAYNDRFGCSDTSSVVITAHPLPKIEIIKDTLICVGTDAVLYASGGLDFTWLPTVGLDDAKSSAPIAKPLVNTNYIVKVVDFNNCVNSDSVYVTVQQRPVLTPYNPVIIVGEKLVMSIPTDGLGKIKWLELPGISCIDCSDPILSPLETTKYTVMVTDTSGCFTVSYDYNVEVLQKFSVDVPSAFTPNGDGINDILFVAGWGIKNIIEFKIFNRFGDLVYQSNDITQGWDGTYKGKSQPNETYMYVVEVMTHSGEVLRKSGSVKILK